MRLPVTVSALLAAASVAGAGAHASAGPEAAAPKGWVKLTSCSRAEQTAVFYGRMRRYAPAERMLMRFTLLAVTQEGGFEPIRTPGLGRWHKSKPSVRAFGYRQRVRGLREGAAYRARVDFRWLDSEGEVIRRLRVRSRVCSQAGPQPNLRARLVTARPTATAGVTRYSVRVANVGGLAADDVGVRLSVDGAAGETKTVPRLDPAEFKLVSFLAPACTTGVEAVADPDGAVAESSEADNAHASACSLPARRR